MIQKATWIIPGILVTLLLGLLWAMPAFAADAGDIEFLNSAGKKAINYVSLNGPAADGGFNLQVEDQDLNEPTAYTDDEGAAGRLAANDDRITGQNDTPMIDWTDLADMSDDGKINANDIVLYDEDTDGNVVPKTATFNLDVANGRLTVGANDVWLEFELNERLTIGAFVSTKTDDRTDGARVQGQIPDPNNAGETIPGSLPNLVEFAIPVVDARLVDEDTSATWLSVLADPDGDGNLVEHITATVTVEYEIPDPDNQGNTLDRTMPDFPLKVSVMELKDDANDIEKLTGYAVRVSSDGVKINPADDDSTDPIDVVIVDTDNISDVGITLSYQTVYQGMGSKDQIGLVTVDSSGGTRTSVALRETSASSGKFRAMVEICDSGDTADDDTPASVCQVGQDGQEIGAASQPGMVMMPVDAAGDTITVHYRDASPRTNRSANISLDTNTPAFSGITPDSGTAGKDAEPDVSYEVVDGESGIASEDDDEANSIWIVAALFEADTDSDSLLELGGPVIMKRDDLNVDDITDGFSVEARLREGGTDELDAGDEEEYEIRWWAVAMDVAGNTGSAIPILIPSARTRVHHWWTAMELPSMQVLTLWQP